LERPALSGSDRSHNLEGLSLVKVWFKAFQNKDHGLIFIHNKLTVIKQKIIFDQTEENFYEGMARAG
jgi:hypothetical protein